MADGGAPIGQQIDDYASQVADINRQISAMPRGDGGLLPGDKDAYDRLKRQRDALATKAQDLLGRGKKAGADLPDFASAVKKASAAKPKEDAAPEIPAEAPPAEPAPIAPPAAASDAGGMAAFRQKYPQYNDMPDDQLADSLYKKHYADMPREEFDKKLGIAPPPAAAPKPDTVKEGSFLGIPIKRTIPGTAGQPTTPPIDKPMIDATKYFLGSEHPRAGETLGRGLNVLGGMGAAGGGGLAKPVVEGVKKLGSKIGDVAGTMLGTPAKEALQGVKTDVAQRAAGAAEAEQGQAAKAGKALGQIETQQPAVAEQRAVAATKPPLPGQQAGTEAKSVVTKTQEQVAQLAKQYEAAGKTTEEAQAAAAQHQGLVDDAKAAVDDLEKKLVSQPGTEAGADYKSQLGGQIYEKTEALRDKYRAIRSKESGYDQALAEAGDALHVDTTPVSEAIAAVRKKTNSLTLDPILDGLEKKLGTETGDVVEQRLSVPQADSLRKSIDSVLATKMMGDKAIDSEAAVALKQVRDALVQATDESTPALKAARAKWAELSSPLDIVSRKGPLRKIVNVDPLSEDAAMANAQIVGHVIQRAEEGHGVFSRLVSESPELREPARLYFVQDLFGRGEVPSVNQLQTWLRNHSQSLRQLGLYDEFRSIPAAKQAAERAVSEAQGTLKQTEAQAKTAARAEQQIRDQLAKASKLRDAAQKRLAGSAKDQPTAEDLTAASGKRAEQRAAELGKEKAGAEDTARDYRGMVAKLEGKVDKQVLPTVRSTVDKLYKDKRIEERVYRELMADVDKAESEGLKTAALRKKARDILYAGTVASWAGYGGYRALRAIMD